MDPFANDFDYNDFRATDFACCRCASHQTLASSLGCGEANLDSSQQAQYAPAAFIQLLECSPMSARIFPSAATWRLSLMQKLANSLQK